jgi:CubicO group peptidase (beta-lactamase class C family)
MAGLQGRLDRVIDTAIEEGRIVGAVVLVRQNGEPAYERAAGLADREAGRAMRLDTIFRHASLTKPLVAAAALALIDRGALALDRPVTEWLPDLRPRLGDGRAPQITIRHLLTHTSGMGYASPEPGDPYAAAKVSGGLDRPGLAMAENLRRIAAAPLYFEPGTAWRYGVSTDVLGAVIAKAHGATLGEAVADLLTVPLAMADTGFAVTEAGRLAAAYADAEGGPVLMEERHTIAVGPGKGMVFAPGRIFDPGSFQSGGAGAAGTGPDFMGFLEAIRTGGGPVLRPGTVDLALRNHVGPLREGLDPGSGFGLISAITTDPARSPRPHGRGTARWGGVYGHRWFIDPGAGLSVVGLTNTAVEGCLGRFAEAMADAVYR